MEFHLHSTGLICLHVFSVPLKEGQVSLVLPGSIEKDKSADDDKLVNGDDITNNHKYLPNVGHAS